MNTFLGVTLIMSGVAAVFVGIPFVIDQLCGDDGLISLAHAERERRKEQAARDAENLRQKLFATDLRRELGGGPYSSLNQLISKASGEGAEEIKNNKMHGLLYQLDAAVYGIPKTKKLKRRRGK